MKALRLLSTYLGMFALILGGILVVNRLSRPAVRPWSEVVQGLSPTHPTATAGQDVATAGLRVQVAAVQRLQVQDVVDEVRLSSRARAQPGQVYLLVTLRVQNDRPEALTLHAFGPRPAPQVLLGVTAPRQRVAEPILPGDVTRLGATALDNVTLQPGERLQAAVGFVLDPDERGLSLLVVPQDAGRDAFPALELALE